MTTGARPIELAKPFGGREDSAAMDDHRHVVALPRPDRTFLGVGREGVDVPDLVVVRRVGTGAQQLRQGCHEALFARVVESAAERIGQVRIEDDRRLHSGVIRPLLLRAHAIACGLDRA